MIQTAMELYGKKANLLDYFWFWKPARGSPPQAKFEGNISVMPWKDVTKTKKVKYVGMLSTVHAFKLLDSNKTDRDTGVDIQKPDVILDYNKTMGGVDLVSHILILYSSQRRRVKWYCKLAELFIDISVYNSFILWKKMNPQSKIDHLIDLPYHSYWGNYHVHASADSSYSTSPNADPAEANMLRLVERHFISPVPSTANKSRSQRKCVYCSKLGVRKDTRHWCAVCGVGLYINKCFEIYYTLFSPVLDDCLKSLLELNDGHSESLSDITQVVNELMPGHSAAAVHKCLVAAFPDLQAQQSNNKEEIYYLGLRFIPNVPSEEKIMLWLKKRFNEDKFGSVSCRTLFDIASKELGHVKQNSIGGHVRRAFPNVYTRRSDRLRWYCGISLPEKEVTTAENSRKIWLENACEWLRSNIQEKDAAKEKCSMVYAALHQYVGKVSIENCMAAIKCVFPRVVRKTFDRNAFYVGLQFIHDSVRNNVKFTPVKVRGTALPKPVINEEEQELVYWLQSILYKNDCHREKLIDLKNVLCKKIGKVITEKAALQLVRKAFPDIFYRKRDGLATVKGVEIMPQYKPRDQWLEKATAWVKKILTAKSTEHCERFSTITDILKQGLGSVTYAKIYQILELAFPSIVMKNEVEGKYIYGVGLADNYLDVTYPVFNIEDRQGDFSDVVIEQTFKLSKIASFTDHSTMEDSMCQTPVTPASNDEIKRMEEKLDGLMSVIDQLKNDINSLKEELAQSSRQKDSLIIQLQQTLVLLTQQQYQRMLKPNHACVNGGEIASRNSLSGGEITSGNSLNLPRLASLQNSVHSEKEPGFSKQ